MTLVFKTGAQRDFDEGQIAVGQKLFGVFDAFLRDVLLRSHSGRPTKGAGEMKLAQTGNLGDFGERQILFEIFLDKFLDAAQTVTGKPAAEIFRDKIRRAVVSQNVQNERLGERFGVKAFRRNFGI